MYCETHSPPFSWGVDSYSGQKLRRKIERFLPMSPIVYSESKVKIRVVPPSTARVILGQVFSIVTCERGT